MCSRTFLFHNFCYVSLSGRLSAFGNWGTLCHTFRNLTYIWLFLLMLSKILQFNRHFARRHKSNICFLLSITNKMQCYTILFISVNDVHVSGGFSAHNQELKTVHTASVACQTCLLLPLAVAASKLDIYQMLCVQFWAPDDGRRNCLKHVEHWQQ
jgi:hypothetical protein